VADQPTPNAELQKQLDEANKVLDRARKGDESVMPTLRAWLDGVPSMLDVMGGDFANNAERALVRQASADNVAMREATYRKLANLRAELAGPDAPAVERLLAERAALCWLHLYYTETVFAQNLKGMSPEWVESYQRRIDRAHRRYLSALKALAEVRKLATPVLIGQVNVARRQVNVAASAPAAPIAPALPADPPQAQ
jgi:hypothetical protein